MAAIARPFGQMWEPETRAPRSARLRLVAEPLVEQPIVERAASRRPHVRSRLVSMAATVAVLVATWFGASAISSTRTVRLNVLSHSVKVAGGYRYTVQPGDTLWSIATRLDPSGDPRPLVDRLTAEMHGATIHPGQRLLVP